VTEERNLFCPLDLVLKPLKTKKYEEVEINDKGDFSVL